MDLILFPTCPLCSFLLCCVLWCYHGWGGLFSGIYSQRILKLMVCWMQAKHIIDFKWIPQNLMEFIFLKHTFNVFMWIEPNCTAFAGWTASLWFRCLHLISCLLRRLYAYIDSYNAWTYKWTILSFHITGKLSSRWFIKAVFIFFFNFLFSPLST